MLLVYQILDLVRHWFRRRRTRPDLALGQRAEDIAHRYLQRRGYLVVARNYRAANGSGELDVVAWRDGILVFVEVKSRASEEFGPPERAIGAEKQEHLFKVARDYLLRRGEEPPPIRFDVITVVFGPRCKIDHQPDAFAPRRSLVRPSDIEVRRPATVWR